MEKMCIQARLVRHPKYGGRVGVVITPQAQAQAFVMGLTKVTGIEFVYDAQYEAWFTGLENAGRLSRILKRAAGPDLAFAWVDTVLMGLESVPSPRVASRDDVFDLLRGLGLDLGVFGGVDFGVGGPARTSFVYGRRRSYVPGRGRFTFEVTDVHFGDGPWGVLGIPPTSSREDATTAYRKLALKLHPDRGGCEADMKRLNVAWTEIRRLRGWE